MQCSILLTVMCQVPGLVLPPAPIKEAASVPVSWSANRSLELVRSYLESESIRLAVIQGREMEAEIHAKIPKLQQAGVLRALRRVSCAGEVTYQALDFSGDVRVKKEVITRYLAAETQLRELGNVAICPANYEFRLKTDTGLDGRPVRIFQLKPRQKRVGLFKGELWLDVETGMPLREEGQFVKVPSIFLKRIRFVRDYEIRDGVSIPKSIESTVETRLVGRAELRVQFHNVTDQPRTSCRPWEPSPARIGLPSKIPGFGFMERSTGQVEESEVLP